MRGSPTLTKTVAATAVALIVLPLGACSSANGRTATATASSNSTARPSAASGGGSELTIRGFAYQITGPFRPGQQVQLVNDDQFPHTVTLAGTGIDVTVPGSSSALLVAPAASGQYSITCDFHPNMRGQLVVR